MTEERPSTVSGNGHPRSLLRWLRKALLGGQSRQTAGIDERGITKRPSVQDSIFLALHPRPKFPPLRPSPIPPPDTLDAALQLALYSISSYIDTFGEIAAEMRNDREFMVKTPIHVEMRVSAKAPKSVNVTKGEVRIATALIDRQIGAGSSPDRGRHFATALVNALNEATERRDDFDTRTDELGAHWFEIADLHADSQASGLNELILYVHCVAPLIYIVVGESEVDIDNWVRHERFAGPSRKALDSARTLLVDRIQQH